MIILILIVTFKGVNVIIASTLVSKIFVHFSHSNKVLTKTKILHIDLINYTLRTIKCDVLRFPL